MPKYKIYAQIMFEIQAGDERAAKATAIEKFEEIEKSIKDLNVTISEAKVADSGTGYFIK